MSKPSNRKSAARQAAEEAQACALLAAQDIRFETQREAMRRDRQQLLAEVRQELARDQHDAEDADVENYRAARVSTERLAKVIAPQFLDFITGRTREQARASTQEIVAELAGQTGTPPAADRPRDLASGRFISSQAQQPADRYLPSGMTADELAKAQSGTLTMQDYATMRDRLGPGRREPGLFG